MRHQKLGLTSQLLVGSFLPFNYYALRTPTPHKGCIFFTNDAPDADADLITGAVEEAFSCRRKKRDPSAKEDRLWIEADAIDRLQDK